MLYRCVKCGLVYWERHNNCTALRQNFVLEFSECGGKLIPVVITARSETVSQCGGEYETIETNVNVESPDEG
jgi:hypothetical protein